MAREVPGAPTGLTTNGRQTFHQPEISIVIPVRDVEGVLERQLGQLARQDFRKPWEIVVSDNGSSDGTGKVLDEWRQRLDNLRVVDSSHQPGVCGARNVGIASAKARNIAICDADDLVSGSWVTAMHDSIETHDAVIAGSICILAEPISVSAFENGTFSSQPPRFLGDETFAFGCNIGFSSATFRAVGPFDHSANGADDVEWCLRAARQGIPLVFCKEAKVVKAGRGTLIGAFRQHRIYSLGTTHMCAKLGAPDLRRFYAHTVRKAGWMVLRFPSVVLGRQFGVWFRVAGDVSGAIQGAIQLLWRRVRPAIRPATSV